MDSERYVTRVIGRAIAQRTAAEFLQVFRRQAVRRGKRLGKYGPSVQREYDAIVRRLERAARKVLNPEPSKSEEAKGGPQVDRP